MEIDWNDSSQPSAVVGTAPDGGFFVHSSHHPYGTKGALDRARRAGVESCERGGEIYFPLPWIRSEQARALRYGGADLSTHQVASTLIGLDEKVLFVQQLVNVGRSSN